MAKKKTAPRSRGRKSAGAVDLTLPQNIVLFGEQNPEDKKIYIAQSTYKEIHRFAKGKTENESGGVLVGNVVEEFGKTHIIIRAFIEAKKCEGTPTTLKFTHESWEYIHTEAAAKYPEYKILGWIHTHPDFGIFLSEYDKFIHNNFFNEENQVAYVVDPIQNIEGFYFWINDKIERCKGFFLFDRTGVKVTAAQETENAPRAQAVVQGKASLFRIIMTAVMGAAIIALSITCFSLNRKISILQNQQQALVESANASLYSMSQQIGIIYGEVNGLHERLTALEGTQAESQQPDDSEADQPADDPVSPEEPPADDPGTDGND